MLAVFRRPKLIYEPTKLDKCAVITTCSPTPAAAAAAAHFTSNVLP